jgi:hypothetical protein
MPRSVHRRGTILLSASLMVLGAAMVVRTIEAGGGAVSVGILLGVLFALAGAGRLWIALRSER